MRVVAVVAFLALALGATLGIAMTVMLIDDDGTAATETKPAEPGSPAPPRPADGGPAEVEPPDRVVEPPPAPPPAVDAAPRQVPEKLTPADRFVLPITFPRNGFDPERVDREQLRRIAELMVKDRRVEVEVIGYAAVDEDPDSVERLGSRRAKLAASLLSGYGPSRSRFTIRAGGASAEHGRRVVLQVRPR
jgi:outer membrane protein OmpA-like peptidoglycan-associated protein